MNNTSDIAGLAQRILDGERAAIGRAITLVESNRRDHEESAQALLRRREIIRSAQCNLAFNTQLEKPK